MPDKLDNLVVRIFEIIDTYYIEWQAEDVRREIQAYMEEALVLSDIDR